MWLFLLFVAVPVIEIALFIEIGGWIGLWPTIAVVVLTAAAGAMLVRHQGLAVLTRLRAEVDAGGLPGGTLAEGALLLVAGVTLLTPGFFTDACGFALLVPPVRKALIRWLAARVEVRVARPRPDAGTVEGEWEEVREPEPPRPGIGSGGDGRPRRPD